MAWNIGLPEAEWVPLGSEKLDGLVREVEDTRVLALDTETTGLVVWKDFPLFWSLSWGERRICMPASTLPYFRRAFADSEKKWVFANAKYDVHMLANLGIEIRGELVDTQVMHALLYEEQPHGLKEMAASVLGWRWSDFFETFKRETISEVIGTKANKYGKAVPDVSRRKETIQEMLLRFEKTNIQALVEYSANDAYGTFKIYETLKKELEEAYTFSLYPEMFATLADLFFKLEVPFTKCLYRCERKGVKVDRGYMASREAPVRAELEDIERKINNLAGYPLNPRSTLQLRKYFFEDVKVRPLQMTKGGKTGVIQASLDEKFLDHYAPTVPMAKLLLRHRELSQIFNTVIKGFPKLLDGNDRIHTRFNQGVRTGRLSSSGPNMQNIKNPEEDEFGLRGAFVAPKRKKMLVFDYDQIEMRLLAVAAMEEDMIQFFRTGKDIHTGNAEMVLGPIWERRHSEIRGLKINYETITEAKKIDKKVKAGELPESELTDAVRLCVKARRDIKTVSYAANYGAGVHRLAGLLEVGMAEAEDLLTLYKDRYKAVDHFFKESIAEVERTGYAFSVLGRRRFLPQILAGSKRERGEAERQANNHPIQSSASDVAKLAMLLCMEAKLEENYGCEMLLQVHDELLFECPEENVQAVMPIIQDCMEHSMFTPLAVPLTASGGFGDSWLCK